MPAKLFFAYARKDGAFKDELIKHLTALERQSVIETWHDREITAGDEWRDQIDANLEAADVILLLVSADFIASDYCFDVEMKRAIQRHDQGEARVIPVILRPVEWKGLDFGRLQALPTDAKPVTEWANQDSAFADVAKGIRKAIEKSNP